jgi:hypothetical protein
MPSAGCSRRRRSRFEVYRLVVAGSTAMNIALIATATGFTAQECAVALRSRGHDVRLESRPGATAQSAADMGQRLNESWTDERPEVVVALDVLAGLATQVANRGVGIGVVQCASGLPFADDAELRRLEPAVARAAARVLAPSAADAQRLRQLRVPGQHLRVVAPGVDTDVWTDGGPAAEAAAGRRVVARLGDVRGVRTQLLPALAAVPEAELVLVHEAAPVADAAAHGSVLAAARDVGAADRVRVEAVDPSSGPGELPALLRSADLFVSTTGSARDLPLALRAMACGLPLVAPRDTLADTVVDGITGVQTAPGPAGLRSAVRGLLADDVTREGMALAAADRARSRFAWSVVGTALDLVLAELRPEPVPVAGAASAAS